MNDKQNRDLDALSGIKDEIVDKNTVKRALLKSKRANKRPQKLSVALIAAALVITVLLSAFVAMLFAGGGNKQVPVYEGMTVLDNYQGGEMYYPSENRFALLGNENNGNNGDNGNHFGHDKKPSKDVIEEDMSVTIPEQDMYYANPGQDIYINVHISNPDNFEILSFTLNGKKYSSYMFEEGSDMENLVLKVNVGDVEGVIVEYTIDAIKYVDGTEIKDVIMEGDRTVSVGIATEKQPEVQVSNELIGINGIEFSTNLTDELSLISKSGGRVFAAILDADSAIDAKELSVGDNTVKFEGLKTDTYYRYVIAANYDDLSGEGTGVHILFEKEFYTQKVFAFKDVVIGQGGIDFGYVWNEGFTNDALVSLVLYFGEEKISELDVSNLSVDGLLSNNQYRLVATYLNNGETETVEYSFKTLEKAIPEVEITENQVTHSSFDFEIGIEDVDGVGELTKLELIHESDTVNLSIDARAVDGLLPGNAYTLKATYVYDLNNGNGEQILESSLDVNTVAYVKPTVTFKNLISGIYSVSGEYEIENIDNTLISYTVALYKGDELVEKNAESKIEFDTLESFTDCTVRISYTYDLRDGRGEKTESVEQTIKTLPYVDVTAVTVRSGTAVFEGETVYLQVTVDNPFDGTVTRVKVNGVFYPVASASGNNLFVEIKNNNQLGSGETALTVENIEITVGDDSYKVNPINTCSDEVFVCGSVDIVSLEFVNSKLEPVLYGSEDDEVFLLVTLDNFAGYEIKGLEYGGMHGISTCSLEDIKAVDESHYYVPVSLLHTNGTNTIYYCKITFGNSYVNEKSVSLGTPESKSNLCEPYYCYLLSEEGEKTVYISSVEDFLSISGRERGCYYELTCDLDFSDVGIFRGIDFRGVFNGNGYAIKNVTYIGEADVIGVFTKCDGIVENLDVENLLYVINCEVEGVSQVGGIVGEFTQNGGVIRNCSIDENSHISVINSKNDIYVGGICGIARGEIICGILNCNNYSTIEVKLLDDGNDKGVVIVSAGGICGLLSGNIVKCNNYGNIIARNEDETDKTKGFRLSGIAGRCSGTVTDCINYGTINSLAAAKTSCMTGGIVGELFGQNNEVTRCENYGDINGPCAGGICGYNVRVNVTDCVNYGKINGIVTEEIFGHNSQ